MDLETHEFFQVIDARPEQRKNMTFISTTRSQTVLVVQRLMEAQVRRGSLLTAVVNPAAAEPSLLDLEALLRPAAFKDFCQGCLLWRQTESGALKLHLQQAPALQALPPMPLPPFISDSDPLEVLLPRKTALVESSLRPSLTVTACVPLTAEDEECVRALVDVGAVGAAERTGAFVASLPYFSEAAVRRLEDLQIVQRHVDEFQERALALVCPLRLGATVSYADPVLVAAAWLNPSRALDYHQLRASAGQQPKAVKQHVLVPERASVVTVQGPAHLMQVPRRRTERLSRAFTLPAGCDCVIPVIPKHSQLLQLTQTVKEGQVSITTAVWGVPFSPEEFVKR